jgi:uncharacterized protein YegL
MSRPGGQLANRPLHFFWVVDCSGSMAGDKIQSLNTAVKDALPEMKRVAAENPNAQVLVRVLAFSQGARWIVANPTPLEQFTWTDLSTDGCTDMGAALREVATQLRVPPMPERALPPVVVLVSDGQPTDNFDGGLSAFMKEPWGKKAVRIAIAIGRDCDRSVLQKFIDHPELKPLEANSSQDLAKQIRWASTVGLQVASSPPSQLTGSASANNMQALVSAAQNQPLTGNDVW